MVGLQELRRWPSQAGWITTRLNRSLRGEAPVRCHATGKAGAWGLWEGIAVLSRLPILERGSLDLGGEHRVANWVRVRLGDAGVLEAYNTHLSARDEALRNRQAGLILDHLATRGDLPTVLVGDLNAGPSSPALRLLGDRFRSAHAMVHGEEPARTWPARLRPGVGRAAVIDYVLVDRHVQVVDAWVTADRADPSDPTLFASDHFGVAATIRIPGGPRT